jgi:hypothetical protein
MKTTIRNLAVLAVTIFASPIAHAQGTTYVSNLEQTSIGSVDAGSDLWRAALFGTGNNASGYIFNSVQLMMADASGNPSGFTVMLYASDGNPSGGNPGSSLGTLYGSLNPATSGMYSYTPSSTITLLPHTEYYIVLTAGTTVATGAFDWSLTDTFSYNTSGGWGVGNYEGSIGAVLSSGDGLSWGYNRGNLQFALNATPVPEPSTELLLGLGGILILGFGRWKAKAV